MEENKAIKQSKKERIKNILMKAGYDPTIHYTRKEKKKFTRIVKKTLFLINLLNQKSVLKLNGKNYLLNRKQQKKLVWKL